MVKEETLILYLARGIDKCGGREKKGLPPRGNRAFEGKEGALMSLVCLGSGPLSLQVKVWDA